MPSWRKVDLHIHSALTAASSLEMTPRNIVNRAHELELAAIAITDYHAADNVLPVMKLARQAGIICLPGIEVQTREEIHLLCYFPTYIALHKFSSWIQSLLDHKRLLTPDIGQQLCFDVRDNVIEKKTVYLQQSIPLSLEETWHMTEAYGGCCVPAHLDRPAFSVFSQLGFIPTDVHVSTLEVTDGFFNGSEQNWRWEDSLAIITASNACSLQEMARSGYTYLHSSLDSVRRIWQWLLQPTADLVRAYQCDF